MAAEHETRRRLDSRCTIDSGLEANEVFGHSHRTLGAAAGAAGISSHGDGLLVLLHILQEGNSALKLPAVDGLSRLAGVLEGDSQVGTAGAGRLGGLDLGRGVSNLAARRSRASVPVGFSSTSHAGGARAESIDGFGHHGIRARRARRIGRVYRMRAHQGISGRGRDSTHHLDGLDDVG